MHLLVHAPGAAGKLAGRVDKHKSSAFPERTHPEQPSSCRMCRDLRQALDSARLRTHRFSQLSHLETVFPMPTYEYACSACGHEWEQEQRIIEPPLDTCPSCQQKTAKRLVSAGNFILKGGGWYADLYSKPNSSKASSRASRDSGIGSSDSSTTKSPSSTTKASSSTSASSHPASSS